VWRFKCEEGTAKVLMIVYERNFFGRKMTSTMKIAPITNSVGKTLVKLLIKSSGLTMRGEYFDLL
jgi:hypothetical protein